MFAVGKDIDRDKADGPSKTDRPSNDKASLTPNAFWQSLALGPAGFQAKLTVSQPNDPSEQEADHVADRVMAMAESSQHESQSSNADSDGGDVGSSAGRPLDALTRNFMELRFGNDFNQVRVHTDSTAADSAAGVGARAYTVGSDIVFASGEYAPETTRGRRLISHELAHVVQQRSSGVPALQRQTGFGEMYTPGILSYYETYKAGLGPTGFSSQAGGHKFPSMYPLTRDELLQMFTGVKSDLDKELAEKKKKIEKAPEEEKEKIAKEKGPVETAVDLYVEKLNQAFRVFKIDTVEAQAAYIANAWHESNQFRHMTETSRFISGNKPYEADPTKVKVDIKWLNEAATGTVTDPDGTKRSVQGYQAGGPIHPLSEADWQKSFIGRGPIQVTNNQNYVQVIAMMEKRADELKAHSENFAKKRKEEGSTNPNEITPLVSKDELELREAIARIKADPREAANPKYAFMFSAGFMKMPRDAGEGGDVKVTRSGKSALTSWMGKQPSDAKKNKGKAYDDAYKILMKKWEADTKEEASIFSGSTP